MSIDEEFSRSQTRRAKANYNRSPLEFIFTKSQQVGAVISMILYFQYFVYRTERVMDSYLIEHSFLQDLRESVAPSSNETYETQYLVFRPVEEGQGLGNIMNGLLAIQMLGLEFNRTVCVDKDWTGFHQAFHEINYELCDELSSRESIQSSRTLRFLNYNQPPNECDLKAALASNTEVLYIITNTYPRWPEVPPRLWEHHYEPRSELIDAMPYSHRPSVVVHLRHGDDKSDIRAGLDNATFHALGKTLPSNTFLVTNNVIWYNFFESLYGWDHPNWQQISHSALFIDWPSLNQTAAKPTNTSITQDVNIQLFCDWYTILMADKVYHTHSDFSLSAIHWNDIESKTIQGVDPSNKLQLSDESWRLESTMPPLVDRSGNGLAHCDIGPIPSGDDSPEDDFFGGPVVDDQYDANYGKTVNIFRERIRRSNTNRVDDDKLDAFTLPDEENPFRFENLVSYKRTSSITKYNDDQVLGEMSPRFLQREKPPDWVDDIIANSNADDDFNDKIATVALSAAFGAAIVHIYQKIVNQRPKGSSLDVIVIDDGNVYLLGGNWKCIGTAVQNKLLIQIFNKAGPIPSNVEISICAPYPYFTTLLQTLRSDIRIGVQDCSVNLKKGAHTGEVAVFQLKDID